MLYLARLSTGPQQSRPFACPRLYMARSSSDILHAMLSMRPVNVNGSHLFVIMRQNVTFHLYYHICVFLTIKWRLCARKLTWGMHR